MFFFKPKFLFPLCPFLYTGKMSLPADIAHRDDQLSSVMSLSTLGAKAVQFG